MWAGKNNYKEKKKKKKRNKHLAEVSSDFMRRKFSLGLKNKLILFPNMPLS